VVYPVLTNEEMTTQSQRYNCFTRNGGNVIPKHAGPEAKGSNPTAGLVLLWARNPFRENLRKATITFVMLVSVAQLGSQWTDFHEILYSWIVRKFVEKSSVALKCDRNDGCVA